MVPRGVRHEDDVAVEDGASAIVEAGEIVGRGAVNAVLAIGDAGDGAVDDGLGEALEEEPPVKVTWYASPGAAGAPVGADHSVGAGRGMEIAAAWRGRTAGTSEATNAISHVPLPPTDARTIIKKLR